jgi:hypothetical protein
VTAVVTIEGNLTPAQRRRRRWGTNLSDTLGARGMTAKLFHKALTDAGLEVTLQAVYLWLNGRTAPRPEHQVVIATTLGVPANVLFPLVVAA